MGRIKWLPSPRAGALMASAFFVQMTAGCLSHEYQIPTDELTRLAQTPPASRGQHVHVVQGLGQRRSPAVAYRPPAPPPPAAPEWPAPPLPGAEDPGPDQAGVLVDDGDVGPDLHLDLYVDGGGRRHYRPARSAGPGGGTSAPGGSAGWRGGSTPTSLRGTPPPAAGSGWRGTPPAGSGWRGSPPSGGGPVRPPAGGGGTGIGHIGGGGGGGGGSNGDAMVVLAVVLVAVAVVAGVALVASEGMRFDGYTDMAPDQSIHLKNQAGGTATVALADLTLADVRDSVEASVKDDEDYGLGLRNRAPLDRTGLAFKLELGTANFNRGLEQIAGMASQIQVGGFFTRNAGVMLDIGLSGGALCCGETVLTRHSLALEGQYFPLALGPLHLGAFAKGGIAIAGDADIIESGPIVGGGALIELALTTRLALTFRAAANAAQLDTSGWSTAGALTGGIAIY